MGTKIGRKREFDNDKWLGVQVSSFEQDFEWGMCDELKLIGAKKRNFNVG